MIEMDITNEQLIEEMRSAVETIETKYGDDPGLTAKEWGEVWGLSLGKTRERLKVIQLSGKLIVGKRATKTLDLKNSSTNVYRYG